MATIETLHAFCSQPLACAFFTFTRTILKSLFAILQSVFIESGEESHGGLPLKSWQLIDKCKPIMRASNAAVATQRDKDEVRKAYEKRETFIKTYGVIESAENFGSPYFYNPSEARY